MSIIAAALASAAESAVTSSSASTTEVGFWFVDELFLEWDSYNHDHRLCLYIFEYWQHHKLLQWFPITHSTLPFSNISLVFSADSPRLSVMFSTSSTDTPIPSKLLHPQSPSNTYIRLSRNQHRRNNRRTNPLYSPVNCASNAASAPLDPLTVGAGSRIRELELSRDARGADARGTEWDPGS
jgi:hypothetical protein